MIPGRSIGLTMLVWASLSSCSKQDDSGAQPPLVTGTEMARSDQGFGRKFDERLRADPNSEPAPVKEGDLPPVSLTTEPVRID